MISLYIAMHFLISTPYNIASITKKELKFLWYPQSQVLAPTMIKLEADVSAIYRINLWCRTANKCYMIIWEHDISTFDQLFETIKACPWSQYITSWQKIHITANTIDSLLYSEPAIQSISKKAVIDSLWWSDESWSICWIHITVIKNHCYILLNTSWESLHRRWYRIAWDAPIKENIAAALVLDTQRWYNTILRDPMCGSGTIMIEAAMIAKNIAPWLTRSFALPASFDEMDSYRQIAKDQTITKSHTIIWSDRDPSMISLAAQNATRAWVECTWEVRDISDMPSDMGTLITNPPYGKRLQWPDLKQTYDSLIWWFEAWRRGWFVSSYDMPMTDRSTRKLFNWADEVTWYKVT